MPKLFFYTIASVLLIFGISEARKCTGERITLKSGWTLTEAQMYCEPQVKSNSKKKSSPAEFLNYIVRNLCLNSQDVEDIQKEFHDNQYDLTISVKGRCYNGQKHGNFDFIANGKRIFTTKFREDEVIKTSCHIKGDNTDFIECFFTYIK